MRVVGKKYEDVNVSFPLITEPNQAFTVRQILEQYSRGEVTARITEPSDDINDSNYSDDDMLDKTIDFNDDYFDAAQYMKDTKFVKNEKDKSKPEFDEGNQQSPDEANGAV